VRGLRDLLNTLGQEKNITAKKAAFNNGPRSKKGGGRLSRDSFCRFLRSVCQNHRDFDWSRPHRFYVQKLLHYSSTHCAGCRNQNEGPAALPIRDDLNDRWQSRLFTWVQEPIPSRFAGLVLCPHQHGRMVGILKSERYSLKEVSRMCTIFRLQGACHSADPQGRSTRAVDTLSHGHSTANVVGSAPRTIR
jgi:hypothetical protein